MKEPPKSWSIEDKAQIAKMIVEGLSFSKIGEAFSVTKNAVIGLVKRTPELEALNRAREAVKPAPRTEEQKKAHLAEKGRAYRAAKAKAKTAGVIMEKPKPVAQKPIQLPVRRRDELQTAGRPLSELSGFQCRWAVNDADAGQEHLLCGSRTEASSSYCTYHKAKAFGKGTFGERSALHILKKHAA